MVKKESVKNCQRVSVVDAAKEIGCHPQYLRTMLKEKKWDLGKVIPPSNSKGQYTYLIFRSKLDKFLGIETGIKENSTQ